MTLGAAMTSTKLPKKQKSNSSPIGLEDLFNQVSSVVDSDINPPLMRVVLTPRSAEVCLKLGVNPESLKIRDIDSFWAPGQDPSIQRLKHETYIQRRFDLMKQCRIERRKISSELSSPMKDPKKDLSVEAALRLQQEQSSTLVKLEQQRLEKLKLKQEKELEQIVQYEANRAKLQADLARKQEEEKTREMLRIKQQEKREKLQAEERRLHDLQKLALEEAEEMNRRRLLKEAFDREQEYEFARKKRLAEERKKALEEEEERRKKHEEHQRQVQAFFEEEQRVLCERLESMQSAEQKKQDAMMHKQKQHAEKLRARRKAIEERIQKNLKMAKFVEEKRKSNFMEKQMIFEETQQQRAKRLEEERRLHSQELALQEERRRLILAQQQQDEEARKEQLQRKFEMEQKHIREVNAQRERENYISVEKKRIKDSIKLDNVDRVSRVGEYKRMSTLKKIESSDQRTLMMMKQRQSLIDARRDSAAKAKLQKEAITRVMEEVRSSATKASKVVKLVQSGKISLEALVGPNGALSPSRGAGKRRVGKPKTGQDLVALSRSSQSAGAEQTMSAGGTSFFSEEEAPKPYVSPYAEITTASG